MTRVAIPLLPRSIRIAGVCAVVCVIGYFSLFSAPPAAPTRTPFWDKHLHFAAYAALALMLAYATAHLRDRPALRAALVVGCTVAFGAGVELAQGTLPNRYFGWGDLLANALGSALVGGWFLVERRIRYVRVRHSIEQSSE